MNPQATRSDQASVTDLRTHRAYQPDYGALARNRLLMARTSAGLSVDEFAATLSPLLGWHVEPGHVRSWENDVIPPGDVLVAAAAVSPASSTRLGVTSHKFVAAHVGLGATSNLLVRRHDNPVATTVWPESWSAPVEHPSGRCNMHVWPFGSVVFHLVEELDLPDIASLALWRYRSYEENLSWASALLRDLTQDDQTAASYVFSFYWVHTPIWIGRMLDSALRIICTPRVLLDREVSDVEASRTSAQQAERELLAGGFQDAESRPFGVNGVSTGYASWSSVVYHAFDQPRALTQDEIVACELTVQAVWVYCEYINCQVEHGGHPIVDSGYGWRFLRAAGSLLGNPRSQETGQYRMMRDAIVETSRLPAHLALAVETLKEESPAQ